MIKMLFIPDTHLRDKDPRSLPGYIQMTVEALDRVKTLIVEEGITHLVFLGDIFDGACNRVSYAIMFLDILRELKELVNGHLYNVVGNHIALGRNSNPELMAIQPNTLGDENVYTPSVYYKAEKTPLLNTPRILLLAGGRVQVDFHHWHPKHKAYKYEQYNEAVQFRVGLYHDQLVAPTTVYQELNIPMDREDSYLSSIYDGMDVAVLGHFHANFLPIARRNTTIFIPGSLYPTSNNSHEFREVVLLPLLTVEGADYKMSTLEYKVPLEFVNRVEKDDSAVKDLQRLKKRQNGTLSHHRFQPISAFIDDNGYSEQYKTLIGLGMKNEEISPKDAITLSRKMWEEKKKNGDA